MIFRSFAAVGVLSLFALAACGGNSVNTTPAPAAPINYTQLSTIAVPGVPPAKMSFDIGWVDPIANQYYLADKVTNGVDVVSTTSLALTGTAGAGQFQGAGSLLPGQAHATNGGPNGLVPLGGGIVFAGDGNSTMKVVNANNRSLLATINVPNPYTGTTTPANGCSPVTSGAGNARVDEMDYDPTDNVVLAESDSACPPFVTFFSAAAPYNIVGQISYGNATGGVEQPRWDPTQKKFLISIPSTIANPNGEIDVIDPVAHAITNVLPLPVSCQPAGLALGRNEHIFIGCSTNVTLTLNAATGALINQINMGGADEVYYNPTLDRFYAAASNNTGGPIVIVTDGSGNLLSTFVTATGSHSIAVDPNTDHVFVPIPTGIGVWQD
jgi:hypothetical protein